MCALKAEGLDLGGRNDFTGPLVGTSCLAETRFCIFEDLLVTAASNGTNKAFICSIVCRHEQAIITSPEPSQCTVSQGHVMVKWHLE